MKPSDQLTNDDFVDYIEPADDFIEELEDRRRGKGRKDLASLRRKAEQRIERIRLQEQLGYYDFEEMDELDI